ncbi:uncharacterized protein LOC132047772 [Lycium ferocissimum]|uniref:uncharacterized protein LOC132047772 n=1 Tax=Lycium ferocissimum TaxID=112874 RepID=UPI002814BFC1|nr:uncharacterized protein LOC132047772 [Lycium ferocissimum]
MAGSKSRTRKLVQVPRQKGSLSNFNNLPDNLLIEILIRLPSSKQAIRCKLTTSGFRVSPGSTRSLCIVASCDDLILCSDRSNYFICNILTRQWTVLPPNCPRKLGIGFLIEPNCVDNARYQVLQYFYNDNSGIYGEIFSSEQGQWTRFVVASPRTLNYLGRITSLIACGRMLYGLNYKSNVRADFVLAFDPFTNDPAQILHIIDLPLEARDIHGLLCSKLGVCQGRLLFAQVIDQPSRYPCISVWELEDYTMGKWTLVHKRIPTIKASRVPKLRRDTKHLVSVLAFHPYNEDLVCLRVGNYHVVMYNIRTDKVESSTHTLKLPGLPQVIGTNNDGLLMLPITQKWWPTPVRKSL